MQHLGYEGVALPALDFSQVGVCPAVDHNLIHDLVQLLTGPTVLLLIPAHNLALQAHAQRDVHTPHLHD